ncbi:MAG: flagellar hook-basal body complex protein FliE [Methylococcales bacterium]|jgi:flagellar hook-basal body complex protein FliE|nr:flagellar hook-basal body complex protein FliE [Methylococcales bacterium]MBT7410055.1 flagellar hook-basal body complex protein FliE [Methylococcales bacterium]
MSDMPISSNPLLMQMRMMSAAAKSQSLEISQPVQTTERADFGALFSNAINQVNATQKNAGKLAKDFERGIEGVSLAEVMVAKQKAGLAFTAVMEVRNKLTIAYKDIMTMPV